MGALRARVYMYLVHRDNASFDILIEREGAE